MGHGSTESHGSELGDGASASAIVRSPQEALPGFVDAFDEEAMKGHLEAALFGGARPSHTVDRCTPTRPFYIPGECCVLRYRLEARNRTSGAVLKPTVMGRIFPSRSACDAYMRSKLAPLAQRVRHRPEVAPFAAPAATIGALNLVVHVWPVDGELPTLVEATDPRRMIEVLRETLPPSLQQRLVIEDCRIERVSYRRRRRCVLRYTIAGRAAQDDEVRRLIVYGKINAFGDELLKSRMIDVLRDSVREPAALHRFALPRSFGARPDLQLSLFEALPGEAHIGSALEARLCRQPAPGAVPLEQMVATSGNVAAMLHACGVELGRPRTLDDELAGLASQIALVRRFVPSFGARAQSSLQRIAALAEQSEPQMPRFSHGDFKHEQLLFDGASSGLVDFDEICQAEPALDLGKFLAHLRVEVDKIQRRASMSSPLGEELAEQFLRAYVSASAGQVEDERRLRLRTTLYEAIALLRLALLAQQDLDESRAERTAGLVEERVSSFVADRDG